MSKLLALVLAACELGASGQTKPAAPATKAFETNMPRDKAEATFKDPRVMNFLKVLEDAFKEVCTIPDSSSTRAQVILPNIPKGTPAGASGYASTYYEVAVPCSAKTTVTINAEFTPLTGERPPNIVLSFKQQL